MVRRLFAIAAAIIGLTSSSSADVAVAPAGRYIINTSTWSGTEFQVYKGTVTTQLKVGEILFSTDGTILTSTATLGSGGSATLPLPEGATNYIQNRDTLQAGTSFYVQKGYAQDGIVASGGTSYIAYPSTTTGGSTGFWCNDVESTGGESSTCFYAAALYSDNPWAFYAGAGKSRFLETHIERGNELRFYAPAETYQRYVAFKSSAGFTATDSNQTYVLPRSTGTVGQVLAIQSVDTEAHLYWKDDGGGGSSFPSNAILLKDSDDILWSVSLSTAGSITTTSLGSQTFDPLPIQIVDADSAIWNVTVSTTGAITTEIAP